MSDRIGLSHAPAKNVNRETMNETVCAVAILVRTETA